MPYIEDGKNSSYSAQIDAWDIHDDMMTDTGHLVGDLEPIGDCVLSPGDEAPIGRTPDGDLAYVIHPDKTSVGLTRAACAMIAATLARDLGLTEVPDYANCDQKARVFLNMLSEAAPPALYADSAHLEMELKQIHAAILSGDLTALPENLQLK